MNSELSRIDYIRSLISDCRYDDAFEALEIAQEKEPENWELFYEFARLQFEMGDYASAVANYEELIEHHQSAIIYYNLGEAYECNEQLDKAIGAYLRATAINEKFPFAYKKLGMLFMARNDFESAKEFFEDYLKLDVATDEKERVEKVLKRIENNENTDLHS